MKSIEFKYRGEGLYIVDGEQNWGDSYGTYYPEDEVDRLVEVTIKLLKEIDNWVEIKYCKDLHEAVDNARAATKKETTE